jgi:hypothetical protein
MVLVMMVLVVVISMVVMMLMTTTTNTLHTVATASPPTCEVTCHRYDTDRELRLLSVAPARGYLSVLTVETIPAAGQAVVRHSLPRIAFPMVTKGGMNFTRRQFPVRLAYAMSCQKSQGQTLHRVVMDTRHEPFAHGTAYVSCSRTREFAALGFLHAPVEDGRAPTFVNVVLQRVLQAEGVLMAEGPPALRLGESGASSDEGAPAAPAQQRARRQRGEPAPASKHKHALSLRARREATASSKERYMYNLVFLQTINLTPL